MTLNLLKMCVGVDSVAELRRWQTRRLKDLRAKGEDAKLRHWTRHAPRRGEELLDGGSLYWIIKGRIQVRQRLVELERRDDTQALKRCALVLDPELVETVPFPARPIQGWRYLAAADAPPDLARAASAKGDLPPTMLAELRALGLI